MEKLFKDTEVLGSGGVFSRCMAVLPEILEKETALCLLHDKDNLTLPLALSGGARDSYFH